ncbi:MAG: hypothetical protein ACI8UR_002123 [Natronomonas sp.]|jgi:hypothetical protein|uniref:DUF7288 family protein n=1 Tax=Natronomonas sp. TaxID=2184060 RepID=UPI00398939EE
MIGNEHGQAYTLEAFIASLLLISSLTFALQVTAVTPLSASTANQHIENQQRSSAAGALVSADQQNVLKPAVLYWNDTEGQFHNPERGEYYTNTYPDNGFGDILNRSFAGRGLAVNVLVHTEGNSRPQRMVYNGQPSDNAASASRTVTIYDGDWLRDENNTRSKRVSNASFYADDEHGNSLVYNVVRVEVTVWRM